MGKKWIISLFLRKKNSRERLAEKKGGRERLFLG
jgi:hypothetical protein